MTDEELNLDALRGTYSGRGSVPLPPDLMLKLLVYEHSVGQPQPVRWFEDLNENKPVQWLVFGLKPSQTALYEFRDRVQPLLRELNQQVVRIAIDEKLTDASCGALDGTLVAANASRHRLFTLETVEKHLHQLEQEIAKDEDAGETTSLGERPSQEKPLSTESASSSGPDSPPIETKPPAFMGETVRGKKRQQTNRRRAQAILKERHQANMQRRTDKRKKGKRIRVALGDPMAPLGLDKQKTYRPLYNVQTMTDVKTDFVLAYATIPTTTDSGQLVPMIDLTNQATNGTLTAVLVDSGYPSGKDLAECEQRKVIVFGPWNENSFTEAKRAKSKEKEQIPKDRFTFDPSIPGYLCPQDKVLRYRNRTTKQKANGDSYPLEIYQANASDCASCPLKAQCVRGKSGARTVRRQEHEELIDALKARMNSPEGKKKYRDRGCTVERRFADLKTHRGLQRFSGRTPERADAQVGFAVLAHNLQLLDKLRKRREAQTRAALAS